MNTAGIKGFTFPNLRSRAAVMHLLTSVTLVWLILYSRLVCGRHTAARIDWSLQAVCCYGSIAITTKIIGFGLFVSDHKMPSNSLNVLYVRLKWLLNN